MHADMANTNKIGFREEMVEQNGATFFSSVKNIFMFVIRSAESN
jgi:hypothetical protein